MAKTEPKTLERTYTIPLRKEFRKVANWKQTKKAVKAAKEFLAKHMKSDDVRLGKHLNEKLWQHGIKNPPAKIKVTTIKDEKGVVRAELFGHKIDTGKKEEKKKSKLEEVAQKVGIKTGAKKEDKKSESKEQPVESNKERKDEEKPVEKEEEPVKEEPKTEEKKVEDEKPVVKEESNTKDEIKPKIEENKDSN